MTIHAYDETSVYTAQNILGNAVDFSLNTLHVDPDLFGNALSVSDASKQFASGNPRYVSGITGCELARCILDETHTSYSEAEDVMYLDKSPEYWAGWALAFYQWFSSRSFMDILAAVPLSDITCMYPVYHEMDILQFVDRMDELMVKAYPFTRLKTIRTNCGLSQSGLASVSGVALRQIQLLEQRQRDINMTAASTLLKLSRALCCRMEDLMEY